MKKFLAATVLLSSIISNAASAYQETILVANAYRGVTSTSYTNITGGTVYSFNSIGPSVYMQPYLETLIKGEGNPSVYQTKVCVGGEICGRASSIVVNYPAGTYLQKVRVWAHDKVGDKTAAHLQLYVNGVFHSEQDVRQSGSWLEYTLGAYAQSVTFKSIHEKNLPGGDESVVEIFESY